MIEVGINSTNIITICFHVFSLLIIRRFLEGKFNYIAFSVYSLIFIIIHALLRKLGDKEKPRIFKHLNFYGFLLII